MATNLALDQELLDRAFRVSGEHTKKAAVTRALQEFIARREQDRGFLGAQVALRAVLVAQRVAMRRAIRAAIFARTKTWIALADRTSRAARSLASRSRPAILVAAIACAAQRSSPAWHSRSRCARARSLASFAAVA